MSKYIHFTWAKFSGVPVEMSGLIEDGQKMIQCHVKMTLQIAFEQ